MQQKHIMTTHLKLIHLLVPDLLRMEGKSVVIRFTKSYDKLSVIHLDLYLVQFRVVCFENI